jgi:hypothetical protein
MRPIANVRQVVSKEQKEAKLKEFIQCDLKDLADAEISGSPLTYRLVARSPNSPVARAVGELMPETAALGIAFQIVFLNSNVGELNSDTICSLLDPAVNCRKLKDLRFIDAHELLLLGSGRVWIGDSMRRDPARRDAYESYCDNCTVTEEWTMHSFQHIWDVSAACDLSRVNGAVSASALPEAHPGAALLAAMDAPAPAVPLLH